ncbi:uncharacterized protein [Solanum lycopersicum]|uniref:uncharacterized protein n=1 Tax=Solanum lycopersicum TaxID=4081 RepID=UPI000532CD15|nr:uncharacterized protein LOC104645978 [Solanum lycopersicum]
MTNEVGKHKGSRLVESDTSRICEFLRMNPPSFTSLSTIEDSENFVEKLKNVFDVMHLIDTEELEIDAYQLKNVSMMWFDQGKEGRDKNAPRLSWTFFEETFFGVSFLENKKRQRAAEDQCQPCTMAQGGSKPLACAKCGRNHSSSCRDRSAGCFKYGQNGHFMRDSTKNRYGNGNGGNIVQSSSVAPPDRAAPRRATCGMAEGQTTSMQSLAAKINITLQLLSQV